MYDFTHLIVEAKNKFSSNVRPYISTHDIVDTVEAFHQISFNYFTFSPIRIKTRPVLFTLRRKDNYRDYLMGHGAFDDVQPTGEFDLLENNFNKINNIRATKDVGEVPNVIDDTVRTAYESSLKKLKEELEESLELSDTKSNNYIIKTEISNRVSEDVKVTKKSLPRIDIHKQKDEENVKSINGRSLEINKLPAEYSNESKLRGDKQKPDEEQVFSRGSIKSNIRKMARLLKDNTDLDRETSEVKDSKGFPKKNLENHQKGTVKENIRKIINKFQENQRVQVQQLKETGTKETIKKIIEKEKDVLEKEELRKLQQQILTIIENNPNIVNKELIKNKIQSAVFSSGNANRKNGDDSKTEVVQKSLKKLHVKKSKSAELRSKQKTEKSIQENEIEIVSDEILVDEHAGNVEITVSPPEIHKLDSSEAGNESSIMFKLPEELIQELNVESEPDTVVEKSASNLQYDIDFQDVNSHIDNIMMMIDEIINNIKVEEEIYTEEDTSE